LFLRTAEFLWQEGHTAHATSEEAEAETRQMIEVYADFAREVMAMPVVPGRKTEGEKFPGAEYTYTIEAMMQDKRALQSGTSHFMGQNFARALGIKFQSEQGVEEHAWTTSWGVSTRLIGGLIMTHSDDDGLVLPPRLAPKQVVILPVVPKEGQRAEVMAYCEQLQRELSAQTYAGALVRVQLDARDLRGGEKVWSWVKKGVPLRLEVGPRDIAKDSVFVGRRDRAPREKEGIGRAAFVGAIADTLAEIQQNLYDRALAFREANTQTVESEAALREVFAEGQGGFVRAFYAEDPAVEERLGDLKVTARCIPLETLDQEGTCIFSGKPGKLTVFAKAY
ncbi:MAG: His/Gly/Thr/Pro-type tRNA ligase C-terminal domain-containing protein, partial [Verrucomicrobiota bacterium]